MSRYELRVIKASFFAGLTDLGIGYLAHKTGFHVWYWDNFHMFGFLGLGMLAYAYWHAFFYYRETRQTFKNNGDGE